MSNWDESRSKYRCRRCGIRTSKAWYTTTAGIWCEDCWCEVPDHPRRMAETKKELKSA